MFEPKRVVLAILYERDKALIKYWIEIKLQRTCLQRANQQPNQETYDLISCTDTYILMKFNVICFKGISTCYYTEVEGKCTFFGLLFP